VLIGRYDDRLRKISGHWKIVERAVNVSTVLGLKEEVLAEVTAESTLAD
jgi:hypothetical protein